MASPGSIYTASYLYRGADRMDCTRKGTDYLARRGQPAPGAVLAPSWEILNPALHAMRAAQTEAAKRAVFARYEVAYLAELRARRLRMEADWRELLGRRVITLVCFCPNPEFCHRRLAATELAVASDGRLIYCGERLQPEPAPLIRRLRHGYRSHD